MDRRTFMNELKFLLSDISDEEKQEALDYDNLELFGCSRTDWPSSYACF